MEGKIIDWAVAVIGSAPPIQNVAAFLVVFLAAVPLLWSGMKRFRVRAPEPRQEELIQQTPWLIQSITTIEMDILALKKAIEANGQTAKEVASAILSLDRMIRRIYSRLFDGDKH